MHSKRSPSLSERARRSEHRWPRHEAGRERKITLSEVGIGQRYLSAISITLFEEVGNKRSMAQCISSWALSLAISPKSYRRYTPEKTGRR
jgi:hypothetical protein